MVQEAKLKPFLVGDRPLSEVGPALIAAANEAGGRDNITVLLLRLEEVLPGQPVAREHDTIVGAAAIEPPPARARAPLTPRPRPSSAPGARAPRRRVRRAGTLIAVLAVAGLLGAGAYLALQSVYFVGTNDRGLVTMYRGPSCCRETWRSTAAATSPA
jgi:protein phosphatase